jgi:hypothetical protein
MKEWKMPLDYHTVQIADGSTPTSFTDRIQVAFLPGVANVAGAGEGDAVTIAISGLVLPASYNVQVEPSQPAITSVSAKTFGGFAVTLTPPTASITLAAGTIDVMVFA